MTEILCGRQIRAGQLDPGTGGCLVCFADSPDRVLLLTAGHVVVPRTAKQFDPIHAIEEPATPFGRLLTWTTLAGSVTIDAALIWVDPARVSPDVAGLGQPPAGIDVNPGKTDRLRLFGSGGSEIRETRIEEFNRTVQMQSSVWNGTFSYRGQFRCSPYVSQFGDSGAMVFNDSSQIVGMVVGGGIGVGDIITPIGAILDGARWGGTLQLVSQIPASAKSPLFDH